jgi:hypothetical protein
LTIVRGWIVWIAIIVVPLIPVFVVKALITVIPVAVEPVVMPAIFDISCPPYILPAAAFDSGGKSLLANNSPWPTVIGRTVPYTVLINVVEISIQDDIIRTPYGY